MGSLAKEHMQSITVGAELQHGRQILQKYIPHDRRETAINSKWPITLQLRFYKIKNDTSIILHFKKYSVCMSITNISSRKHLIQ
eukprot:2641565-Ditylum_brightwellii.AAC.1